MTQAQLTRRKRAVAAALGSVRAEGLKPSSTTQKNLRDYAAGKISAAELRDKTARAAKRQR
jgi:Antitoxin VbhA